MKTSVSEHVIGVDELNISSEARDMLTISSIAKRGLPVLHGLGASGVAVIDLVMDIEAVHARYPLDLDQFLAFDEFNFNHDLVGIYVNLDRNTKALRNCFSPRCTA